MRISLELTFLKKNCECLIRKCFLKLPEVVEYYITSENFGSKMNFFSDLKFLMFAVCSFIKALSESIFVYMHLGINLPKLTKAFIVILSRCFSETSSGLKICVASTKAEISFSEVTKDNYKYVLLIPKIPLACMKFVLYVSFFFFTFSCMIFLMQISTNRAQLCRFHKFL